MMDSETRRRIAPMKVVSDMACSIRLVQYPDGRQILQGAYSWTQGYATGFEWKDLPVIMVGVSGKELIDD